MPEPLDRILGIIERLQALHFEEVSADESDENVRPVIDALNELSRRLAKAHELNEVKERVAARNAARLSELADALVVTKRDLEATTVSKDYVANIFRSLTESLIVFGRDGTIENINPVTLKLLGYEESELLGSSYNTILEEEEKALIPTLTQKGFMRQHEVYYVGKNGQRIPVLLSGSVIRGDDDSVTAVVCVARDITERKKAEERLRLMSKVFMDAADPILIADLNGNVTDLNEEAVREYGWPRVKLLGRPIKTIVPPEGHQQVDDLHARCRAGEEVRNIESLRWNKGSEIEPVLVTLSLLTNDAGLPIGIATLSKNIGKLKRTTEQLARSNEELAQYAHVASHDLKEPLRMVASYVQLLASRYEGRLDADADEFIAFAVDGATRMKRLIDDLLVHSEVGTEGELFEPIECETIVDSAVNNLRTATRNSGAVVTRGPLPTVVGDALQLAQVFQNLIGNAIRFRSDERPEVHVEAERQDGSWLFSVRDNGIGIDPEHADRIFVIFQRLHRRSVYPGTGIGLAICKKVVERHSGRIWVESLPGKGSTFYFTIPVRPMAGEELR